MEDKWRKQMQQKMEGYERSLPELSWNELDKALAANRRQSPPAPRWGVHVWGRRIAAAAAVAVAVVGGGLYYFNSEEENVDIRKLATLGGRVSNPPHIRQVKNLPSQPQIAAITDDKPISGRKNQNVHVESLPDEQSIDRQVGNLPSQPVKEENSELPVEPRQKDRKQDIYEPLDLTPPTGGQGGFIAAVYTQNGFAHTSDGMNGMSYLPYGDASSEFNSGTNGILENNAPKSVTYDHDFPIKIGVGIRYPINKRWSLTTGLTYSYLHSTYEASEKGDHWNGKQNLHYIGLPLGVSYNVLSANRFNLYITAGGEMQKLVSGKSIDEIEGSETVKEKRLQWSLNAAVGAQYNFTDNIGLYIEPGVVHYIDNGSHIENYYKYKPTNFNLNLGLRLDL